MEKTKYAQYETEALTELEVERSAEAKDKIKYKYLELSEAKKVLVKLEEEYKYLLDTVI